MKDINEYRAQKEGRITPSRLVESLKRAIERGEIESIVIVTKDSTDGTIKTGWSQMSSVQAVGMLTVGAQDIIDEMRL